MKIAILTGGFPSPDNPAKSIFNLRAVKGLQNYASVCVYHYRFWKLGRPFIKRYTYEGVNVVAVSLPIIPSGSPFVNAFFNRVWMWLSKILLKEELKNYDIFYSIGLGSAPLAAYLAKTCNKKHISQTIGSDLLIYLPEKEKYFGLWKWTQNTNEVLCNSLSLQEALNHKYPKMKSRVAYRGTDLSKFSSIKKTKDPKNINMLFLGGFSHRSGSNMGSNLKGGETLKAVIQLLDENDNLDVIFRIGGPGTSSPKLNSWREQLKNPERVKLIGSLKPDEIPTLMQKTDVVLIPSLSEGLPNVGVEAIASGCLLVGSNVGGIPEIIKNNVSGLLLEAGNVQEWKTTLEDVIINFDKYQSMIEFSVAKAREDFNANSYPKKLYEMFQENLIPLQV